MNMDKAAVKDLQQRFRKCLPDFKSFAKAPEDFRKRENDYKHEASEKARDVLRPYVEGQKHFSTDDNAAAVLMELINETNFLNWRDKAYIEEQLLTEDGDWVQFAGLLLACLREIPEGNWEPPLATLLDWLNEKGCAANISKILPTYFLFLWDPGHHFCIKSRFTDQLLRDMGEKPLGDGKRLTVDQYRQVLDSLFRLREELSDWQPRDMIDLHSFGWIVTGGWRDAPSTDGSTTKASGDNSSAQDERRTPPARPKLPLNLILAGPPGTGKTHRILQQFVPEFEEHVAEQSLEEFLIEACGSLKWPEVIATGLAYLGRPATVPEIAETPPVRVSARLRGRERFRGTIHSTLGARTPDNCPNVNRERRIEPPLFWKNGDATWQLIDEAEQIIPELLELASEIKNYKPSSALVRRHEFVTFHQSYSYEDFIEGIKPELTAAETDETTNEVRYTVEPGIFLRMVRRAIADPQHAYALFIDEINRANIANVLGELITLLEPDKRMRYDAEKGKWVGGVRTKLPYTHSSRPTEPPIGVPDNLYVIGTMNTADRSIALLDLALRRRFTFEEVMPDHALLVSTPGPITTEDGQTIHLDRLLEAINERIEYLYDRDHTIGHSYLMDVKSLDDLKAAFRHRILPLLQEYFYGDWHKIQLVLRDLIDAEDKDFQPKAHPQAIVTHVVQRPKRLFGLDDESYQVRRSYTINEDVSAASFRKIYETVEQA